MLVLRPLLPLLLAFLALAPIAEAAKSKNGLLRISPPAAGQTDVALATVKKGAKLKVKKAPKGAAVSGGVSPTGSLAVAVTGGKGKGPVLITVRGGGKPKNVKIVRDVLGRGALPASACADVVRLLGRSLRGSAAASLARRIADAKCKAPQPAPKTAAAAPGKTTLARPGAGASVSRSTGTGGGGGVKPAPGNGGNGGDGGTAACANGLDDDGDGQTDGRGLSATNPDPGCDGRDDTDETGEVPVSQDCANSSGVFGGANGPSSAAAAINDPCPLVEEAWMTIAPGVSTCLATSAANNYGCGPDNGLLHVSRQFGLADNRVDFFTINLVGNVDCSATPTIAILSPDGTMHELVEPWPASCGGGNTPPPEPLCSNGVDDDGDGQADAPAVTGATEPDPGCTSGNDETEGSEIDAPETCGMNVDWTGTQAVLTTSNCGELSGAWFNPARVPSSCEVTVGFGNDPQGCSVIGTTAAWGWDATTDDFQMRAGLSQAPLCNTMITVALRRSDGAILEGRGPWTC